MNPGRAKEVLDVADLVWLVEEVWPLLEASGLIAEADPSPDGGISADADEVVRVEYSLVDVRETGENLTALRPQVVQHVALTGINRSLKLH